MTSPGYPIRNKVIEHEENGTHHNLRTECGVQVFQGQNPSRAREDAYKFIGAVTGGSL